VKVESGAASATFAPAAPASAPPSARATKIEEIKARVAAKRKATDYLNEKDEPVMKEETKPSPFSAYKASSSSAAASAAAGISAPAAAASAASAASSSNANDQLVPSADDLEQDRAWYDDAEESGGARDDDGGDGAEGGSSHFLGDVKKFAAKEEARTQYETKKLSAKAQARADDNNAWEENRMRTSGAVRNTQAIDLEMEEGTHRCSQR
jgi:hypothetical protein